MHISPQRLAWITMISALVVFCLFCVGTVAFARWLVFDSPTDLTVTLHTGLGTVGLAEPDRDERVVRDNENVPAHATMTTDLLSQGYIEFSDPYSGEVVTTITLLQNSTIALETATRPRFNVSDDAYVIHVTHIIGRMDGWVRSGLDREVRLVVDTPYGSVRMGDPGNFLIDITSEPALATVTVRKGNATLVSNTRQTQHLTAPARAELAVTAPALHVTAAPVELLPNWDFSQSEDWPVEWACYLNPSEDFPDAPAATREFTNQDGRVVARIMRYLQEPSPFIYGCVHYLADPQNGLDVTGYEDLRLRVTMQIHHQSLSACGIAGSECPIMLKMKYIDRQNQERWWIHGFYARYDPNEGGKKVCDTCREPHELINKDTWYTYESGNFFTDYFPVTAEEDQRPASIISLEFYAAGHEYEVMFDEVALMASS